MAFSDHMFPDHMVSGRARCAARRAARAGSRAGLLAVLLPLLLLTAAAWAAVPVPGSAGPTGSAAPATGTSSGASAQATSADVTPTPAGDDTSGSATGSDDAPPPALGAVGITGGFPSYQTAALEFSAQVQYVGFQAKVSDTAIGPYFGLELRGYPPVPIPVPLFVGIGGGYYGGEFTYYGTLGAHVPLALHTRLDLEGGVANVPLLAKRSWAPYLSVGVSYAFPFTPTYGGYEPEAAAPLTVAGSAGVTCETSDQPDASKLGEAFHNTLQGFLASARATYGSIYTDLTYSYTTSTSIHGDVGIVKVHYHGSVRTIATGRTESASGNASATYRWNGCAWLTVRVEY